ncbi:MAG TPA: UDP-N-acetylenolpyruvoylglucosamine reductase [Treponema sp.]|nr:UDP-N-acetylenolpyruvoylglucosamine reductase [Treponema sp.]
MDSIREIGENIKNSPFFRGSLAYDEPLAPRTTMRVGGPAALFVCPADVSSAAFAASRCRAAGLRLFVLGGGSNLVVDDGGFCGAVLSTGGMRGISVQAGEELAPADDGIPFGRRCRATLCCGAGASIASITEFCEEHGLWGLCSFAGLPGTAGGAAYMNARCYGQDISSVISAVEYVNLPDLPPYLSADVAFEPKMYHNDGVGWDYKRSPFMGTERLISAVQFSLCCLDPDALYGGRAAAADVREFVRGQDRHFVLDRKEKGHFNAPSAGSVFKNDRSFGKPSGMLVDEAGLKGLSVGGAQVAPWHGNFIINTGGARAADIRELVRQVQQAVCSRSGCMLEPEIIFV